MIELKITGSDVRDFWIQSANTLALILNGGKTAFPPEQGPTPATPPTTPNVPPADPVDDVTKTVVEPAPRTRKPKATTIEAKANKPAPVVPNDPLPPALAATPATLTADNMRERVRDIIAAHKTRGHEMPACVEYVQKLFKPFAIDQAAKVPPERFAEFIEASKPYLDGTAK